MLELRISFIRTLIGCGLLLMLLAGCIAGHSDFSKGETALTDEHYDQAVASFLNAVQADPSSYAYRMKLQIAREKAGFQHKEEGDKFLAAKDYSRALEEYQLAVDLDGSLYAAAQGAEMAGRYLQAQKLTMEATELLKTGRRLQAKDSVEKALSFVADYQPALQLLQKIKAMQATVIDGVELEVTSSAPITLDFHETKLPDVFSILTKLSGINFILDEDVRAASTTLYLEKATFAQALELLLRMNKLDKKVLNSKTIILFPKSRDKEKQFEDQLIHTFYLSHIDAKKAVNLLRTMLQVRKIYVNEELNAIIMRDTPEVIKLAQRILEANDRADSEVVFDLELIEVNHSDTRELGLKLSNYSIGAGLGDSVTTSSTSNGITTTTTSNSIVSSTLTAGASADGLVKGFSGFKDLKPFYSIPTATFRLLKTLVDAEVLASPKIRVKNKEKAKVHIGSREPVITVTINGDQTTESVQYVDVGVKLDVEPTVELDNSIVTKLGLEVSNVSGKQTTSNGTSVLTISTTNANTSLTLKDGEQTVIGGLIRDDKGTTKYKVPLLGDIPLIGELFNGTDKTKSKREILLSITPHIVRSMTLPGPDVASIWSGGEDDLKYGRNFGSFADEYSAGQEGLAPQPAPEQPEPAEPPANGAGSLNTPPPLNPPSANPVAPPQSLVVPGNEPIAPPQISAAPANEAAAAPAAEAGSLAVPPTAMPTATVPVTPSQSQASSAEEPVVQQLSAENVLAQPGSSPKIFVRGPQLIKVGETFNVEFPVAEMSNLFSASLFVLYDPKTLEFINATEGNYLGQDGKPTVFTHTLLPGNGRVVVGLKQNAGGQGVSGAGELFSMQFQALAPGTTQIRPVQTNFRDQSGARLPVESAGMSVQITK